MMADCFGLIGTRGRIQTPSYSKSDRMFYEIEQPPAAHASAILLHSSDNVAVARVALPAGHSMEVNGTTLVTKSSILPGHKIAIRAIAPGDAVHRYGNVIGFATQAIA